MSQLRAAQHVGKLIVPKIATAPARPALRGTTPRDPDPQRYFDQKRLQTPILPYAKDHLVTKIEAVAEAATAPVPALHQTTTPEDTEEPTTQGLRHVLGGARPTNPRSALSRQGLTPQAQQDLSRTRQQFEDTQRTNAIRRAFAIDRAQPSELLPYRIMVCWRVARELGRAIAPLTEDELLTVQDEKLWTLGRPVPADMDDASTFLSGVPTYGSGTRRALTKYRAKGVDGERITLAPLPGAAENWFEVFKAITKDLGVTSGSRWDAAQGLAGIKDLDSPTALIANYPTPTEMQIWDEMIVQETVDHLIKNGTRGATKTLVDKYGLLEREITPLIRMARAMARRTGEGDIEEDRALMIMRLEKYIERVRKSMDYRLELMALKQIAIVSGMIRMAADSAEQDFISVMRKVSDERKQVINEAGPKKLA